MGHDELLAYAKKIIQMMDGHATKDSLLALLPKEADIVSRMEVVGQLLSCAEA